MPEKQAAQGRIEKQHTPTNTPTHIHTPAKKADKSSSYNKALHAFECDKYRVYHILTIRYLVNFKEPHHYTKPYNQAFFSSRTDTITTTAALQQNHRLGVD